jgi:hypothetical protein
MKINIGNEKLKNLLKKLFENKEFEITLKDTEHVYDGYNNVTDDIVYEFKFHVVVRSVIGKGIDAVGDMDIIIDSITKNGNDHYNTWVESDYDIDIWYIQELRDEFYLEYLEDLPFSVYTTVYGYDEKRKGESVIDESVIKRIIRKLL